MDQFSKSFLSFFHNPKLSLVFQKVGEKNGFSINFGANFSQKKVHSYHGQSSNVFNISCNDSINHFYPLLLLYPKLLLFFRIIGVKYIFGQFQGQFYLYEGPKLPGSCQKYFYYILEWFSKSFLPITSFIIQKTIVFQPISGPIFPHSKI